MADSIDYRVSEHENVLRGNPCQRFVFTLNNYNEDDLLKVDELKNNPDIQYACCAKEVGEQGTPHLQGYIHFKSDRRKRFQWFHDLFGRNDQGACRCWVKLALGQPQQSAEYITKGLKRGVIKPGYDPIMVFLECGQLPNPRGNPGASQRNKWTTIRTLAQTGHFTDIADEFPMEWILHRPKLESQYGFGIQLPSWDPDIRIDFFWGPTGTGKSRTAYSHFERTGKPIYVKDANTKWWDGYMYEPNVLLEELDRSNIGEMTRLLKMWCDKRPFRAEVKGRSTALIRPEWVIICSNYSPEMLWGHDDALLGPMRRRMVVTHFDVLWANHMERAAPLQMPPLELPPPSEVLVPDTPQSNPRAHSPDPKRRRVTNLDTDDEATVAELEPIWE